MINGREMQAMERPITAEHWIEDGGKDRLANLAARAITAGINGLDRIHRHTIRSRQEIPIIAASLAVTVEEIIN